jgi:hypothetical protein
MTPIEQHLAKFKAEHPDAQFQKLPSGAHVIKVPNVALPVGWNQKEATVVFLAPAAYPGANPDCFWLQPGGVLLASGQPPNAANDTNRVPETGEGGTWFSWHVQQWNPNRDDLNTYFNVIMQRLVTVR